jgi:hypothetical protein
MRYLVDTQIFIWALICPQKIAPKNQTILQSNEIFPWLPRSSVGASPDAPASRDKPHSPKKRRIEPPAPN